MPDRQQDRVRLVDLAGEALIGLKNTPTRTIVPATAIVFGVAVAVLAAGLGSTSSASLRDHIRAAGSRTITVTSTTSGGSSAAVLSTLPDELRQLPGIVGVAEHLAIASDVAVTRGPRDRGEASRVEAIGVASIDSLLELAEGSSIDGFAEGRSERVALVSAALAASLHTVDLGVHPTIVVKGVPFTVIGIVRPRAGEELSTRRVIIPTTTLRAMVGNEPGTLTHELLVTTRPGEARAVADVVRRSVRSDGSIDVAVGAETTGALDEAEDDLAGISTITAIIVAVIAFVGILVNSWSSVTRRVTEIGLRRTLGAARAHISVQFLMESSALGLFAGVVGASIGVIGTVLLADARGLTPVLDAWAVIVAPVAAVAFCVAASLLPAIRASQVDPIDALRRP